MKKVLVVSTRPPYPLHNGSAIRTFQAIRFLSRMSYDVDVVYLTTEHDNRATDEGLAPYCRSIRWFKVSRLHSCLGVLWGLLTNRKPLQVNYYYFRSIERTIGRSASDYDLIFYNNIRSAEYLKHAPAMKVLDFVDAISMNYAKAGSQKKGLWHYLYKIDHRRCLRYERGLLARMQKCMIISEIDRDYILYDGCPYGISVIENYVKECNDTIRHEAGNYNIVFVGTMNYEPNISAVGYFVKEIFPAVQQRYPGAKFYIVGNKPTDEVRRLASDAVVVTGFVEEVAAYLMRSAVVAVPMISGAGIQNKILEAMSMGGCVVTTPIGFEGLCREEGAPFVASSAREMIDVISRLFDSADLRSSVGRQAKEYVRNHYSEEVLFSKFRDFIQQ